MKNLVVYSQNAIDVHLTAVERKRSSESKRKLILIEENIRKDYSEYELRFKENKLEDIQKKPFYQSFKTDLQSLYDFQNKTIAEVKGHIEKSQVRTIRNTCQNCTINSANTLDHLLPQGDFPEYIVNPKNLFPCCSQCNSYKNMYVHIDGVKQFLNLYLDNLPEVQYLFVNLDFDDNNEIDFCYKIDNKYEIETKAFTLIQSHYDKLHLLERMRLSANEVYSEIENLILLGLDRLTIDMIFEDIKVSITNDQKAYGFNHWKCVLKLALINDIKFRKYIEEKKNKA